MSSLKKNFLIASLLASLSAAAFCQTATANNQHDSQMGAMKHANMDPSAMQEHAARRSAALKEKLKISPAQEGVWNSYVEAMKPGVDSAKHPSREEMAKLTTPERVEKMKAIHAQHTAEMEKRSEAIKSLYAALNPDQKKILDAEPTMGMHGPTKHMRHQMFDKAGPSDHPKK